MPALIFQGKGSRIYAAAPAARQYFLYSYDRKRESWIFAGFCYIHHWLPLIYHNSFRNKSWPGVISML